MIYQLMVECTQQKCYRNKKPARVSHKSIRHLRPSSFLTLTNVKAACYTSSSMVINDFLFNTLQAKMRANCGRLKATHFKSRLLPTNCLFCGRRIHALATENILSQQFSTRPSGRAHLRIMPFIHDMFFCSRRSKSLELNAQEPVRKINSFCCRLGTFDI